MAKIATGDLDRFLSSGWKAYPAALVFGSDDGAVRETADRLVAAAAGPNPDPLNLIGLDGDTLAADPARLADEMQSFGLFGGFRVIHVRGAGKVPMAALEAILESPPENTFLVMEAGELKSGANSLRSVAERHRRIATLTCYADNARQIANLIDEVLGASNLTISREAKQALAATLGADRGLSRAEVEKLAIYAYGSESIGIDMVMDIVADAGRHETSSLLDRAFGGDLAFIEPEANRLFSAGTHPSALLTQALGHVFLFRRALRSSLEDVSKSARIHFSRMPFLERALARWNDNKLQRVLALLSEAMLQTRTTPRLAEQLTIRALWSTARIARPDSAR